MDVAEYIKIPFKKYGRDRNGVDCYGLCRLIYQEKYNRELPDYTGYQTVKPADTAPLFCAAAMGDFKPVEMPTEGTLVLMIRHGVPGHVGLCIGSGQVIHTSAKTGTVIERLTAARNAGRIEGYYVPA